MSKLSILQAAILLIIFSVSTCSGAAVHPEVAPATPQASATATVAPTVTATPEYHSQPFTWNGKQKPLLLAHYMPWYQSAKTSGSWGWHWTMNSFKPSQAADGSWQNLASHFVPLTGPYDSSDERILEYQVALMKLSGIDGVIVDWYGTENFNDYGIIDGNTARLLAVIKKAGMKFALCYEDQTVKNMVSGGYLLKKEDVSHAQKVMQSLQKSWFKEDVYLKVDGRPVLYVFGPQYFTKDDDWKAIFTGMDPQPALITLDNHVVASQTASFPWPPMWASKAGTLSEADTLSYLGEFYDKAKSWKYHVGGAFPGFYDIYKEAKVGQSYGFLDAQNGKTFHDTLQSALSRDLDAIQLITWNDYGEGTMIEPTTDYGYRYLEMVQQARQTLDGKDFTYPPADLRVPLQLYQMRVDHATDLDAIVHLNKASEALMQGDLKSAQEAMKPYQK